MRCNIILISEAKMLISLLKKNFLTHATIFGLCTFKMYYCIIEQADYIFNPFSDKFPLLIEVSPKAKNNSLYRAVSTHLNVHFTNV